MLRRLMEKRVPIARLAGTIAVFTYLLLGGPLPGPIGERHGSYLAALFGAVLSIDDIGTLAFRSSLVFLLACTGSWLLLVFLQRGQQTSSKAAGD